jgi:hypothetical protein
MPEAGGKTINAGNINTIKTKRSAVNEKNPDPFLLFHTVSFSVFSFRSAGRKKYSLHIAR